MSSVMPVLFEIKNNNKISDIEIKTKSENQDTSGDLKDNSLMWKATFSLPYGKGESFQRDMASNPRIANCLFNTCITNLHRLFALQLPHLYRVIHFLSSKE